MITVKNLSFSFISKRHKLEVLRNISFGVNPGEFISIIGPSGCGKTTLLKAIGGLYSKRKEIQLRGEILVKGVSSEKARQKREFGFAFQNPVLLPWCRVVENIRLPLDIIGPHSSRNCWDVDELLELMGLSQFRNAYPHELSGGMQQRVNIARTLIFKPSILLLDEPFGSLDEVNRERLNIELLRIRQMTNATVLFVTHSLSDSVFLSDRVLVISPRPGQVEHELQIPFAQERTLSLKEDVIFTGLVRSLRDKLER